MSRSTFNELQRIVAAGVIQLEPFRRFASQRRLDEAVFWRGIQGELIRIGIREARRGMAIDGLTIASLLNEAHPSFMVDQIALTVNSLVEMPVDMVDALGAVTLLDLIASREKDIGTLGDGE